MSGAPAAVPDLRHDMSAPVLPVNTPLSYG